ncbi:DUF3010 family protein [Alteromonas flava]|uniref:DUF3010 family protein n=1 Tax=Alteromonas flava TaxID=2048003 RepID=UPI000C289C97|nr:DUF3010 family protein [Alteromonas flava]
MLICGVDIQGTEAVICLLEYRDGVFFMPDCRVRKLALSKRNRTTDIRYFQSSFKQLMGDYKVTRVVIRERPLTGKFSGGALGFKMEAAIQLIDSLDVETLGGQQLKASLKRHPVAVSFKETGLKQFQEGAFHVAHAAHMGGFETE